LTWTALLSLLGVHIIGMASPGPDVFLVLRLATKSRRHAIAAVAGISTGATIWMTLTVFGFAAVITANPLLMGVIQLVGGCYLIYMGISMAKAGINTLRELRAGAAPALGSEALRSPKATFRQGFFTNMSNPKIVLFLTAVLSQFIPGGRICGDARALYTGANRLPNRFLPIYRNRGVDGCRRQANGAGRAVD